MAGHLSLNPRATLSNSLALFRSFARKLKRRAILRSDALRSDTEGARPSMEHDDFWVGVTMLTQRSSLSPEGSGRFRSLRKNLSSSLATLHLPLAERGG